MATLSLQNINPFRSISPVVTAPALETALVHIFKSIDQNLWLVGGTALAGFYAEHRRSDDLNLFALDAQTYKMGALAVKSLNQMGALFLTERHTPRYYHADVAFLNHRFTIDVVLDENLKVVGNANCLDNGIWVADLVTLFAMKSACLVSRCSEKDLFDLHWLFSKTESGLITILDLIRMGSAIDSGLTVETLLISLNGTHLRKDACHFIIDSSVKKINETYKIITDFKIQLIALLLKYEKDQKPHETIKILSQAVKDQKKLR